MSSIQSSRLSDFHPDGVISALLYLGTSTTFSKGAVNFFPGSVLSMATSATRHGKYETSPSSRSCFEVKPDDEKGVAVRIFFVPKYSALYKGPASSS